VVSAANGKAAMFVLFVLFLSSNLYNLLPSQDSILLILIEKLHKYCYSVHTHL
jgi:hypothetical protein